MKGTKNIVVLAFVGMLGLFASCEKESWETWTPYKITASNRTITLDSANSVFEMSVPAKGDSIWLKLDAGYVLSNIENKGYTIDTSYADADKAGYTVYADGYRAHGRYDQTFSVAFTANSADTVKTAIMHLSGAYRFANIRFKQAAAE